MCSPWEAQVRLHTVVKPQPGLDNRLGESKIASRQAARIRRLAERTDEAGAAPWGDEVQRSLAVRWAIAGAISDAAKAAAT